LVALGCTTKPSEAPPTTERPFAGVETSVTVVDDPALAEALQALAGDWQVQTGGTLRTNAITSQELLAAPLTTDTVLFGSRWLGHLVESRQLRPIDKAALSGKSLQWADVFELLRLREASWGEQVYALPLGSPVFVCYCRQDWLTRFDKQPPRTWQEYHVLVEFFSQEPQRTTLAQDATPWAPALEPLAPGWAGLALLARAAPYAKQRDQFSTLFSIDDMRPLIDSPAFVRALQELAADHALAATPVEELTPERIRQRFWRGDVALAWTWASSARDTQTNNDDATESSADLDVMVVELPGSTQVYDSRSKSWHDKPPESPRTVPLLGISGRWGGISAQSQRPDATLQLLTMLSHPDPARPLVAMSPATTLFRRSQAAVLTPWLESQADGKLKGYADSVAAALSSQEFLSAPRIPGQQRYLAALDEAVASVLNQSATPADALTRCAQTWQAITLELDTEKQRTAYLHSLGLDQ
jgi:multiple sugar transport system substrate-binding protein